MALEFVIYTDESATKGARYSHFYGGVLVRSTDLLLVETTIRDCMKRENLLSEIKWSKVTEQYLAKYTALMNCFFELVAGDRLKIRIMFVQNRAMPRMLSPYQREHQYFLLYYQFIKHAFGLRYSNRGDLPISLRIYLDQLPDTKEKCSLFKNHLAALSQSAAFRAAAIRVPQDQIAEVDSHHHPILQCLDVVLGAMQFRLNNKHLEKPPGSRVRGKKTRAKEELYKLINTHIRKIYPNFNIGISTGRQGNWQNLWEHRYRHWSFVPSHSERPTLSPDNLT